MVVPQIEFRASEVVRAALAGLGRTEDLRFSPDNRLLAIAGYAKGRLLILRIDIGQGSGGLEVGLGDFMEITSDGLGNVHGLDFIDDRTLAVANRDGLVSILRLPEGELAGRRCHVRQLRRVKGGHSRLLSTPGSIATRREPAGRVSLFVCNNYAHRVTRHVVDPRWRYLARKNHVLLQNGLDIPDGIALSNDGKWIAVSSHGTHDVKLYSTADALGPDTEPAGVLRNANYPHGLRFTADDRHIVVADAGSPMLHVYDRGAGWSGPRDPARSVAVLDDETYRRGAMNIEEGGPKGLDIDRSNTIVAATCEEQILAFFSLASVLGNSEQAEVEEPLTA